MGVEGIVLAAGLSRRTGPAWKLGLPLGDRTVLEWSVGGMVAVCDRVIVVGGHRLEEVRRLVQGMDRVEVVANPRYRQGMFTSVKVGVARLGTTDFFVLPGDCPLVGPDVYRALLAAAGPVVVPAWQGRKGHPVLIRGLAPAILAEPDESNLRVVLGRVAPILVAVNDRAVVMDLDHPQDLATLRQVLEG